MLVVKAAFFFGVQRRLAMPVELEESTWTSAPSVSQAMLVRRRSQTPS